MRKKGQAAMEFLMTYGWAIIVVLAAIAALAYFGVLSPANLLPERTTFPAPIQHLDNAVISSDGTVTLALANNVGARIEINSTGAVSATDDCDVQSYEVRVDGAPTEEVSNGANFILEIDCGTLESGDRFSSDISITYLNTASGLERPHQGSVQGRVN